MVHVESFSLETSEENKQLLRNLKYLQKAKNMNFSRLVVEALNRYVNYEMKLYEIQVSIEDSILRREQERTEENKLLANNMGLIAINIPEQKILDPRDEQWLKSEARKKAQTEARLLKIEARREIITASLEKLDRFLTDPQYNTNLENIERWQGQRLSLQAEDKQLELEYVTIWNQRSERKIEVVDS